MAFQRETAHRLFASEFNQSRHEIKGQGEKDPSFLVSPLGAKVNRLHVVGVVTDVEAVGAAGDLYRARISDPTGVFTVYAGQYQPEAAQALSQLQPPQYVAITGKAKTYEPEPGSVFVSIRPETVTVVDEATRNAWVLETARRTTERVKATEAARASPTADAATLARTGGVSTAAAEGAVLAREPYALTDLARLKTTVKTAVGYLLPGSSVPVHRETAQAPTQAEEVPAWKPPTAAAPAGPTADEEALDTKVLAAVAEMQGQKGARWDDVLTKVGTAGTNSEQVEESLNRLMDKGLVYEPTLGILKTT